MKCLKCETGTGVISMNTSSATIDGETASTWAWNGNGILVLRYDHANTNYKIVNTGIWDSGSKRQEVSNAIKKQACRTLNNVV